jgi:hypothetical protein
LTHAMMTSGPDKPIQAGQTFEREFVRFPDGQRFNYGQLTWEDSAQDGINWAVRVFAAQGLVTPTGTAGAAAAGVAGARLQGRTTTTTVFEPGAPALRGVDLRLDQFDLHDVKKISMEAPADLDKCMALGDAFWSSFERDSTVFKPEDKKLLEDLFNEELSDRRKEGDKFMPPDASHSYVTRLRELLKEEDIVRQRRRDFFFSEAFAMQNPGTLFPSSWRSATEASRGAQQLHDYEGRSQDILHRRKDYEKEAQLLEQIVKSATPVFDKKTEEGMTFRIYRIGSLEFRSTQELGMKEHVGAVFSLHSHSHAPRSGIARKSKAVMDAEKITKVTEYVERAVNGAAGAGDSTFYHRYYLVLETSTKSKILTELLWNGTVAWVENEDFEPRNSLAKVIRFADCSNGAGATIGALKAFKAETTADIAKNGISRALCKQYTMAASRKARNVSHDMAA